MARHFVSTAIVTWELAQRLGAIATQFTATGAKSTPATTSIIVIAAAKPVR